MKALPCLLMDYIQSVKFTMYRGMQSTSVMRRTEEGKPLVLTVVRKAEQKIINSTSEDKVSAGEHLRKAGAVCLSCGLHVMRMLHPAE